MKAGMQKKLIVCLIAIVLPLWSHDLLGQNDSTMNVAIKENLDFTYKLLGATLTKLEERNGSPLILKLNGKFILLPMSANLKSLNTYNFFALRLIKIIEKVKLPDNRHIEGTQELRFLFSLLQSFLAASSAVEAELMIREVQGKLDTLRPFATVTIKGSPESDKNNKQVNYDSTAKQLRDSVRLIKNEMLILKDSIKILIHERDVKISELRVIFLKEFLGDKMVPLNYREYVRDYQWPLKNSENIDSVTTPEDTNRLPTHPGPDSVYKKEHASSLRTLSAFASSDEYFGASFTFSQTGFWSWSAGLGGGVSKILLFAGIGSYFDGFNLEAGPVLGWNSGDGRSFSINGFIRLSKLLSTQREKGPRLAPGLMYSPLGGVNVSLGLTF